jgi:hypothetical protein
MPEPVFANLRSRVRNSIAFVTRRGVTAYAQEAAHRITNDWFDRYLHIDTRGRVLLCDLGINQADAYDSVGIGYRAFFSAVKRIPLPESGVTFLDYGTGKGRAVCAAAALSFRRIIGLRVIGRAVGHRARQRERHEASPDAPGRSGAR